MPAFQAVSSLTLDYRGSALAHAAGNFLGAPGVQILFGGPRYGTDFVDEAQPFRLLGISISGQLTDLSGSLPPGMAAVHAREILVADFNKDGFADAFSVNHGFDGGGFPGETDELLFGGATLRAGAVPARSDFGHSASAGDIDGDGDIDILVGNFGNLGLSRSGPYFLKNDGAGGFAPTSGGLDGTTLSGLTSSLLVDVDGDGDLDFVAGNHGVAGSAGWVWKNDGAGIFVNDPSRALPAGLFGETITVDVAAMDFDGDGDQDLILSQTRNEPFYQGSALQFLRNDGTGRFTDVTAERMPVQDLTAPWADTIHVVDMDGDGHKDLVISRPGGGAGSSIALNDGSGRFAYVDAASLGLSGVYWTPVDYNGDGRVDLVSFSRDLPTDGPLTISVHQNLGFTNLTVSSGNDFVVGTAGPDRVEAGPGNDTLLGGDGQDYLRGNEGDDSLSGGAGFDDLHGNQGNDTVDGGAGDDWVVGGQGNDLLYGGDDASNNVVYGNLGDDTCYGGAGIDWVRGGQGNDSLSAGAGDDLIWGDRGDDTIRGGAGADTFGIFGEAGTDRILDFNAAEGDRIRVDPGYTFTTAQVGADVVVTISGGGAQAILVGVQLSALPDGWIS